MTDADAELRDLRALVQTYEDSMRVLAAAKKFGLALRGFNSSRDLPRLRGALALLQTECEWLASRLDEETCHEQH